MTLRSIWFALTVALPLSACAHVQEPQAVVLLAGSHYVALGSSFAAGAAIGPTKPGTPDRCGRTTNNYPTVLAQRMQVDLDDQTCGGATTAHVVGAWNELPAQVDAIGPETRLVTVTIGGNDVNYVGNLFMSMCTPGEIVQAGEYRIPCTGPSAPEETAYDALTAGLIEIARQVEARAPEALLVFVQYVTLVPDQPCPAADISGEYAALNRKIGSRLADTTARIAAAEGALLLEANKLSRNHSPCDEQPWANGMTETIDLSQGAPWHPNASGHRAIAEALVRLLSQNPE